MCVCVCVGGGGGISTKNVFFSIDPYQHWHIFLTSCDCHVLFFKTQVLLVVIKLSFL